MYNFDYVRPSTVDEAVKALGQEDSKAIAGGQTLIPTLKQRLAQPTVLVDLKGCLADRIESSDGRLVVSAGARHRTIAEHAAAPKGLRELASMVGDPQVRNIGTIGGSLANNDPAACYPAATLAMNALIVTNAREIAADDYFLGMFETALEENEIITEIRFPSVSASAYAKLPQPASRFPLVGVFVARHDDGVRVAVTGASQGGVFRWTEAEQALASDFSPGAVEGLDLPPADDMIGDIHGSPEYRAHMVRVMTKRAVAAAGAKS